MTELSSDTTRKIGPAYRATWYVFTTFVLVMIFLPQYLPMVDLPQHAGQLSIWLGWNDPTLEYQEVYQRGPLSPMLVGMTTAFLLAHVVSIELALKIVIAIAVLGIPLTVRPLLREAGGDPWWVFLSFPVGFGFPFSYGFINFCLGVPLALLLILFWRVGVAL